jgi:glycine/D-amino acid oxidase-like deaminating enzyme
MRSVKLADGSALAADQFVFACGPWLGRLFPEAIGERVRPTRQEVFFFGTPAGDASLVDPRMPAWIDHSDHGFYGIPGNESRGFKVADDRRGPPFDPTSGDRMPSVEGARAAREYLHFRFPALKGAPLVEARVCQYENSPDSHLILDRHPGAKNVWLLGGGSGHGYKLGAAIGELAAETVLEKRRPEPFFQLARFA